MNTTIKKLEAYQSDSPSHWREEAEYRRENKSWMRYSQRIAMAILDKMEQSHLTQKALAERMGCSQTIRLKDSERKGKPLYRDTR